MEFRIWFDDASEFWIMNGWAEDFVMDHLDILAKVFNVPKALYAESEPHALAILQVNDVNVVIEGD